jgi:hypothetical protein
MLFAVLLIHQLLWDMGASVMVKGMAMAVRKYLYIREQNGGCDHTIGCGIDIEEIEAESLEDAIEQVINFTDDYKDLDDGQLSDQLCDSGLSGVSEDAWEYKIVAARLIEISSSTNMMPILKAKLAEVNDFRNERKNKAKDAEELKQYEKLKKKFEKK